jgi:methylglutaconyl-CoA hydratase
MAMAENGYAKIDIKDGVGTLTFFHPGKNSLPGALLKEIAEGVQILGGADSARVVVLRSDGGGPFCAGASFDELLSIENFEQGKEFFMGFARLILAMKKCPKFVIARVQGKAVGGGVGVVSAADYALASDRADIKLSELALGIGPFVIGPAVERKIGAGAFSALSLDADWRTAYWARSHGMYSEVFSSREDLDAAVNALTEKLAKFSPEAMAKLKTVFWEGSENWDQLLEERAAVSGKLVLSDFTRRAIQKFKKQ